MEEEVVDALLNGDRETQIRAATDLGGLIGRQRHKLAEKGVVPPLLSMLHSQDFEAVEAALFALLRLASGSERNKVRIAKAGAIPVLLSLLQCQSEVLMDLAMAALLILSSCRANKLVIAASGAIQILVEMLSGDNTGGDNNGSSMSMQAKLDAISTFQNLSTCHEIIPLVVSSGAVFSLLQLLCGCDKSSELVQKVISLLETMASWSEIAVEEVAGTGGAIQALVETVEEGSPQCQEHAVGILLLICKSCREKYRGLILREGIMPGLLQLSVHGTWRAKDMAQDLLLLLRECPNYGSRKKQLKNEHLEQIMKEIDAEGEEVAGTALRMVEEMIAKLNV
ncbi:hypothetical protein VitviT2T_022390 [Vitis vinifera]|uniref:U-box domain-containing protein n=2 Tax=Vitis vinifera TaxID=29760 RepID=D7TWI3_VITVI|eukprot:XP_002272671.1 PREDICTED: U-box domain-containing protein 6 isoform X1 [Vitis vinifera]